MGNIISAARPNETDQTVTDKNPGTFLELHKKCKGTKIEIVYHFF